MVRFGWGNHTCKALGHSQQNFSFSLTNGRWRWYKDVLEAVCVWDAMPCICCHNVGQFLAMQRLVSTTGKREANGPSFFYCLWQPESYFTTFSRHCKNATTILAMLQQGAFVASICGTLWQFMRHKRCLSTSSVKYQWADQLKTISIVLLAIFLTGCKF